jgi:hypothetical protein
MLLLARVVEMLYVQNKSKNISPGDIIAFLIKDDFIGYGKVIAVYDEEALIDEDSCVSEEIDKINNQGGTWDIEIV